MNDTRSLNLNLNINDVGIKNKNKNQIIRIISIKTIFGEKKEDQKERLQLNSPFKILKLLIFLKLQ